MILLLSSLDEHACRSAIGAGNDDIPAEPWYDLYIISGYAGQVLFDRTSQDQIRPLRRFLLRL